MTRIHVIVHVLANLNGTSTWVLQSQSHLLCYGHFIVLLNRPQKKILGIFFFIKQALHTLTFHTFYSS